VKRCAKGIAWFDFADLCDGPRSQADYIEIARWYPTVIISGVPELDTSRENQARRFIALVDEFYDRRVKLIVSADHSAQRLYAGKRLRFEFERTVSRLLEMQSGEYLHLPHLA
jgi:cell division protein ZapE